MDGWGDNIRLVEIPCKTHDTKYVSDRTDECLLRCKTASSKPFMWPCIPCPNLSPFHSLSSLDAQIPSVFFDLFRSGLLHRVPTHIIIHSSARPLSGRKPAVSIQVPFRAVLLSRPGRSRGSGLRTLLIWAMFTTLRLLTSTTIDYPKIHAVRGPFLDGVVTVDKEFYSSDVAYSKKRVGWPCSLREGRH